jgi:hypothetical protein
MIKPIFIKNGVTIISSRTKRGPQWSYTYTMPPAIYDIKWDSKFRSVDYIVEADNTDKIETAIKSIEMIISLMGVPYRPSKSLDYWSKGLKRTYTFYAYMEN